MSIEAIAWAWKQELPPVPKLVLVALCDRANIENGECWPGIATVAKAACISERSVVTYIAALVRNGYVMRQPMRGKNGRHRTNHYWIMFDRLPAPWIEVPKKEILDAPDPEEAPNEPDANVACGGDTEVHTQTDSHGPHATGFLRHIELEPSGIEPSESEQEAGAPSPPPSNFDRNKRQSELNRRRAAEEARAPKKIPVIEGSKPWQSWIKHGHPPTLVGIVEVNGNRHRGWYFDTLYPLRIGPELPFDAKSTGPPLLTAEDEEELGREWR